MVRTTRSGLGEEFLDCVDATIQAIRRSPQIYNIIHQSYRRGLVRRFPYVIFYEYLKSEVIIYAVMHTSRDPQKWRRRMP